MKGRDLIKRITQPLRFQKIKRRRIRSINDFEYRIFSQNGEDGILQAIFYKIKTTNKFFVEFGVEDGSECNTRLLHALHGWNGVLMDGGEHHDRHIHREWITAENINLLFEKYHVPAAFDLLSIDIDGNDYWVWKAIHDFSPRVVMIEYNSSIPVDKSLTVEYNPGAVWDLTNYHGASLCALTNLAAQKGYVLVGCESRGVNAFFVKSDLAEKHFEKQGIADLYRPPKFGEIVNGAHIGHPQSGRNMIPV